MAVKLSLLNNLYIRSYQYKDSSLIDLEELYLEKTFQGVFIKNKLDNLNGLLFIKSNLKKIEVDEDNPFYTVKNNLLYTKDLKTLLIVPKSKESTIEIDAQTEHIAPYAFLPNNKIKTIILNDKIESISANIFLYIPPFPLHIKALNVHKLFLKNDFYKYQDILDKCNLYCPSLPLNKDNDFIATRLIAGFLYEYLVLKADLSLYKDKYLSLIDEYRANLIDFSKDRYYKFIKDFFKTREIKSLSCSEILDRGNTFRDLYFMESIIYRDFSEFKLLLDELYPKFPAKFDFFLTALGLACLYGGLKKVKSIVAKKYGSDAPNLILKRSTYEVYETQYNIILSLFLQCSNRYRGEMLDEHIKEFYISGFSYKKREVSDKERVEILFYLKELNLIDDKTLSNTLMHALENNHFTCALKLSDKGIKLLKNPLNKPYYYVQIEYENNIKKILTLAQILLKQNDRLFIKYPFNLCAFYDNKEDFKELLDSVTFDSKILKSTACDLIQLNNTKALTILLESKLLPKQFINTKLLDMALAQKQNDLVAYILEFKNKNTKAKVRRKTLTL